MLQSTTIAVIAALSMVLIISAINPAMAQAASVQKTVTYSSPLVDGSVLDLKIEVEIDNANVRRIAVIDHVPLLAEVVSANYNIDGTSNVNDFTWGREGVVLTADVSSPISVEITYRIIAVQPGTLVIPPARVVQVMTDDSTSLSLSNSVQPMKVASSSVSSTDSPPVVASTSNLESLVMVSVGFSLIAAVLSGIALARGKRNN